MSDEPYDSEDGQTTATGGEHGDMTEGDEGEPTAPEKEMGTSVRRPAEERSTAPQSPYSMQQVGIGFAILAVGLVVTYALPLVLT